MDMSSLINGHRLTGVLLILAFISFAIGGILPIVGERGNMGIFTLPVREHLLAVAQNATVWRWANIFMGLASVVLLAGLSMLTTLLEGANERIFSRLGLVGFLLAAGLWVIFSSPSREELNEQLARENQGLLSTSVMAAPFLQERLIGSREMAGEVVARGTRGNEPTASVAIESTYHREKLGNLHAR